MSNANIAHTKGARSNGFEKQGHDRAVAMGKLGAKVNNDRRKLRQQFLEAAVKAGLEKKFAEAIKTDDMDKMELCREAMKLVGLDFASSPEMIQKIQLDAKTDNKLDIKIEDA